MATLEEFLDHSVVIMLVQGADAEGHPHYAYVAVPSARLFDMREALACAPSIDIHAFGVILEMGQGTPDETVRKRMQRDFHFDHERMIGFCEAERLGQSRLRPLDGPPHA